MIGNHRCLALLQGADAPRPVGQLSSDHSRLLQQIAEQLADHSRADKEAACQQVREACEEEHSRKRKQLEDASTQERAKLMKVHEAAMGEAEEMTARRQQDSQQFTFTIRGHTTPELSGSIPRQVLEAEPNSVLNRTYNGEWAYATDDQGRACINSDPQHWPLIVNWLSFGSIPHQPSKAFQAECKYWQLDNLLAKFEEQQMTAVVNTNQHSLRITTIKADGRDGFQVRGSIHNFVQRFSIAKCLSTEFDAFGSTWRLVIREAGAWFGLLDGPVAQQVGAQLSFGIRAHEWQFNHTPDHDLRPGGLAVGNKWMVGSDLQKLQRPPFVNLKGSLRFKVRLLFEKYC